MNVVYSYFGCMTRLLYVMVLVLPMMWSCGGSQRNADKQVEAAENQYQNYQLRALELIADADSSSFFRLLDSLKQLGTLDQTKLISLRRMQLLHMWYEAKGQLEEALNVADQVVAFSENRPQLKDLHIEALFNKGTISFKLSQYQSAIQSYFTARKLLVNPDSCELANYDYHLGMVYYRQKNFVKASDYFQKALSNYRYCKPSFVNSIKRQEIMSNIGLCYLNLQQPDSAEYWFSETRHYLLHLRVKRGTEQRTHRIALAVISGNLGVSYARQGKLEEAKKAIEREIEVNLLPENDRNHLVYSLNELCAVLYKQNRLGDMNRYLKMLDSLPELRVNNFPASQYYYHQVQYHIGVVNYPKAKMYIDSFLQMSERVRKEDRDLFRTDLTRSLRILESEFELKKAKQDALLGEERNLLTRYMLLAMILISMFAVWAWWIGRRKNAALRLLNQEKDRMLRVVAHDLRNPIAAIYSMSQLNQPNSGQEEWRLVQQASSGALDLIQEMLEFTDIQQAAKQKANELVSINQLCSDTYRLMQFRADEKGIKLIYEGLSQDYEVKIVAEHMHRAISNLLSNAIKFSERGKEVLFKVERNEKGILISIQDFGIGIPQSFRGNIFDSFTITRRRGTSGEAAFGLGLSIVKSIVEAHQGAVWYISAENMGSTFFIQLPASLLKN